jgi:C4-dicarboxylate-specific signal transduction histidine kinase
VTWWAWTLVWIVLVLGALGVLFLLGRSLWRKGMALARELADAAERMAAVTDQLTTVAPPATREEPAVFAHPAELRRQRVLDRRLRPGKERARRQPLHQGRAT